MRSPSVLAALALSCGLAHASDFAPSLMHSCSSISCRSRLQQQQQPLLRQSPLPATYSPALSDALRLHGGAAAPASGPTLMESLKMPLALAGWYLMSIVYSLLNKEVLGVWKFPVAWSAVQLLVGSLFVAMLWTPLPTFGVRKARFAPTLFLLGYLAACCIILR